jgi:hypothetical protein
LARVKPFGIELPVDSDGEVDLHNFADFVGFEYASEGSLRLKWKAAESGKFTIWKPKEKEKFEVTAIAELIWIFEQVSFFQVGGRDPETPVKEDETLSEFNLLENGETGVRFGFEFHGGVTLVVAAKTSYAETF